MVSKNKFPWVMPSKNEITVAQMAAFFLCQAAHKSLPHLKLIKLMYLADREMIRRCGSPITYDYPFSMPNGPVLSQTLDLIQGGIKSCKHGWGTWVSAKAKHKASLKQHQEVDEAQFEALLDRISPAALDVLKAIWQQFGVMSQWQIRNWTHKHCQEWTDPDGSSQPIDFSDIAKAVGFQEEVAKEVAEEIEFMQRLNGMLAV